MPGVKQEEIDWTGLDIWLEEKKGARVTKAGNLEFLREDEVQVQEVVRTDTQSPNSDVRASVMQGQPLFTLRRCTEGDRRRFGIPPEADPPISSHVLLSALSGHADFEAAKAGDVAAAVPGPRSGSAQHP